MRRIERNMGETKGMPRGSLGRTRARLGPMLDAIICHEVCGRGHMCLGHAKRGSCMLLPPGLPDRCTQHELSTREVSRAFPKRCLGL